jgi:hypothetical protein
MSKRPPHGGRPPKPKPAKRGPKEERLYIPDVEAALNRLLKKKPAK